jgi:hypothetical protein
MILTGNYIFKHTLSIQKCQFHIKMPFQAKSFSACKYTDNVLIISHKIAVKFPLSTVIKTREKSPLYCKVSKVTVVTIKFNLSRPT